MSPDPAASPPLTTKFLTWNLAMLASSAQAPNGWDTDYTEDAIRRFVLRLQPQWVFYQEIPNHVPYTEGYSLVREQTDSHCGSIVTLVREDEADAPLSHRVVDRCAVLSTFAKLSATIANVHLAPGRSGGEVRLAMLKRIIAASPTDRLLVVGDTNTRIEEEWEISALGFDVKRPPDVTWDTRKNRFRPEMREYTTYYTRYFVKGDLAVSDVKVWNAPMDVDGKRFYLSDHFALSGTLEVPLEEY